MAGDNLGASFSIDVTDLKAGLAEANRLIRNSESEFRAAAAGMDDWSNSSEGLSMRIKSLSDQVNIQKQKVNALVAEKQRIIDTMTEEGKSNEEIERAVDGVNKQILKESQQLDKLKGAVDKSEKALDEKLKERLDWMFETMMNDDEKSVVSLLKKIRRDASHLAELDKSVSDLDSRLESAFYELLRRKSAVLYSRTLDREDISEFFVSVSEIHLQKQTTYLLSLSRNV